MNINDVVKNIGQILNIDTNNALTMMDILEDLKEIEDVPSFRLFIKERFSYERFRYMTGLQKFIALKNEFKKENRPTLNASEDLKVRVYSESLYKRVTTIFDEIDYRTQIGLDIKDAKISKLLYLEFGKDEKALKVLNKIGKREDILKMLRTDRNGLLEEIKNIIYGFTLVKNYPKMLNKSEDANVLKLLKIKRV